jgi:pimeloyl-ACP methyl ester carboxylesterase
MPELQVADVTLYYEVQGSGDPLVLIAGTTQDVTGWLLHTPWLSELRTVITFDHRDVGRSTYVAGDYTPADLARDAAALIREAAGGPVDVLGYSLGGAVAQELAIASPDLVRRLILLSTWGRTDNWLRLKFESLIRLAERTSREEFFESFLLDVFTHRWFADPANVAVFRSFLEMNPYPQKTEGLVRQGRADITHHSLDRLGSLSCPTLVIVGAEDALTPPRYAEELAHTVPGARLAVIPEAGHGALFERAEDFQRIVTEFLHA